MSVAIAARTPWPEGRSYAESRQKLYGAKEKEHWNTHTKSKRDELREAFSVWELVAMKEGKGAGSYVYALDAIGLHAGRLTREGLQAGPMTEHEHKLYCYLVATCLVMRKTWINLERVGLARLLGKSKETAGRVLAAARRRGLLERQATFGVNKRLAALARARGEEIAPDYEWEQGACYRPSALLRRLWDEACSARATTDRARASFFPRQIDEATPDPDPDPRDDTDLATSYISTGKPEAPAAPVSVVRPTGVPAQPRVIPSGRDISQQLSEVWKVRERPAAPAPRAVAPPAEEKRPNGHLKRCTCSECSAEIEEAIGRWRDA